jgi:hypothetical protein
MRPIVRVIAAFILAAASAAPAFAQKQLQIMATVSDPSGAEVATLAPDDIKVMENGQPLTVSKIEPSQRIPKVQILIDNGTGMPSESISDLRKGLQALIDTIPNGVETTIVTTAPQPRFLEKATPDHARLVQAISRLTPDSGTGRFVESIAEAVDRIDKDKTPDAAYTIVTVGTTLGDSDARDSDVKKIMTRVGARHTVVYVVLFNKVGAAALGGAIQGDLGQALGKPSGGRFEQINVPNRLVTLLPEIGQEMAKSLAPGAKQFRIIVDRTATGPPSGLTFSLAGGKIASNITVEAK